MEFIHRQGEQENDNWTFMKRLKYTAGLIVLGLTFLTNLELSACSTICLKYGQELLYGHNLNNNGSDIPGLVFINKRGVFKTGRTWSELIHADQRNPSHVKWISRYGSVTFNTFGKDLPDGGMNEAGIYIWEMGLSNSEVIYPKADSLPKLNQMQWMQYILDTCSTLEQAIDCASKFEIDGWGWHFFLGNSNGDCAAIDFVDGKVVIHRGEAMPVPGLFNALYAREVEQSLYFKGFGGLYEADLSDKKVPRYVKTGVMLQAYDGQEKALDYTYKMLDHLFVSEVADWSVVFDVNNGTVHFKTSLNPAIKCFSFNAFDFSNADSAMILNMDIEKGGDVVSEFVPYRHELMAKHIASLPLPKAFCEMGGLTVEAFIDRLARHTVFAEDSKNQPFIGIWETKTESSDETPRWKLTLSSQGDSIRGEISNAKGFVVNEPINQISLVDHDFSFSFRSLEEKVFMFSRGSLTEDSLQLSFNGIEDEYGNFDLFKRK